MIKRITLYAAAMLAVLIMTSACAKAEVSRTVAEHLDLGAKYLLEMNYEQAVVHFLKVIEIEPMNARGYTGAAEAYIGLGDMEKAESILRQGLAILPDHSEIIAGLEALGVAYDAAAPDQDSEEALSDGVLDEVLTEESRHARLFYQYIQDKLIPTGRFIDADMVYWDDVLTMITSEYTESGEIKVVRYFLDEQFGDGFIASHAYGFGFSAEQINDRGYEVIAIFLGEYDGKTAILRYTKLVEDYGDGIRTDAGLGYTSYGDAASGGIYVFIEIEDDGRVDREGGGISVDGDYIVDYNYEDGYALIQSYLTPISTWGMVLAGEPPFTLENTGGERLKDYF